MLFSRQRPTRANSHSDHVPVAAKFKWNLRKPKKFKVAVTEVAAEQIQRVERKKKQKWIIKDILDLMNGLAKWLKVGLVTDALKESRDRDIWKVMITHANDWLNLLDIILVYLTKISMSLLLNYLIKAFSYRIICYKRKIYITSGKACQNLTFLDIQYFRHYHSCHNFYNHHHLTPNY